MALATGLSVSGLLLFGTITSLFAKIAYELKGEGSDGKEKLFRKPWTMTAVMFIGMSFCLPIAYWEQYRLRKKDKVPDPTEEPLLALAADGPKAADGGWRQTLLLAIPTVFDLAATVLMNVGLLHVTASVYQMMRGAEMLFAALFSVVFLKRRLNALHFGGILCCVVGIALVGMSSLLARGAGSQEVSANQMVLGMGLIVASQAVQAAQITFEDFFMADLNIAPLKIVGYEGLFGTIAMLAVMLPVVQRVPGQDGGGVHEDTLDTLHMIFASKTKIILVILLIQMVALLAYNFAGMCVTGQLGAVFRTVLETMRTLFVWLVDLGLFYTTHKLGEAWTAWSFLQAAGFVVLVSGTLIYSRGDEREGARLAREQGGEAGPAANRAEAPPTRPLAFAGAGGGSAPISMRQTPSSFKSTMNIRSSFPGRSSLPGRSLNEG